MKQLHLCVLLSDRLASLPQAIASARPLVDGVMVGATVLSEDIKQATQGLDVRLVGLPTTDPLQAQQALLDEISPAWALMLHPEEELLLEAEPTAIRERLTPDHNAYLIRVRTPLPRGEEVHWSPRLLRAGPNSKAPTPLHGITILNHTYETEEGLQRRCQRDLIRHQDNSSPESLYVSLRAHHLLEQPERVVFLLQRLLVAQGGKLPPAYSDAYYLGCLALLNLGQPQQAEALLWQGLAAYPDCPNLNFFLVLMAGMRHVQLSLQTKDVHHPLAFQPTITRHLSGQVRELLSRLGLELQEQKPNAGGELMGSRL